MAYYKITYSLMVAHQPSLYTFLWRILKKYSFFRDVDAFETASDTTLIGAPDTGRTLFCIADYQGLYRIYGWRDIRPFLEACYLICGHIPDFS